MVQAGQFRLVSDATQRVRGHIGQQFGAGGRTDLIVNHLQLFALLREAQHGFGEVGTACGINPAGTENQMPGATRHRRLAFALGTAIDVERGRGIFLTPGTGATAIKNVIRRIMHQPGTERLCFFRQHGGGQGIDRARQIRLAFGLVHRRMGGGIDDDLRCHTAYRFGKPREIGEIGTQLATVIKIKRDQFTEGSQTALQFPAQLPSLAKKQDPHASRPS